MFKKSTLFIAFKECYCYRNWEGYKTRLILAEYVSPVGDTCSIRSNILPSVDPTEDKHEASFATEAATDKAQLLYHSGPSVDLFPLRYPHNISQILSSAKQYRYQSILVFLE
jgi:hypothetical protein